MAIYRASTAKLSLEEYASLLHPEHSAITNMQALALKAAGFKPSDFAEIPVRTVEELLGEIGKVIRQQHLYELLKDQLDSVPAQHTVRWFEANAHRFNLPIEVNTAGINDGLLHIVEGYIKTPDLAAAR